LHIFNKDGSRQTLSRAFLDAKFQFIGEMRGMRGETRMRASGGELFRQKARQKPFPIGAANWVKGFFASKKALSADCILIKCRT